MKSILLIYNKLIRSIVCAFCGATLFITLGCKPTKANQVRCTSGQVSNFFIRNNGQVWSYVLSQKDLAEVNQKIYPKGFQFMEPDQDFVHHKPSITLRLQLSDGRTLNYYFDSELENFGFQIGSSANLNHYRSTPTQFEDLRLLLIQIMKRQPNEYKNLCP